MYRYKGRDSNIHITYYFFLETTSLFYLATLGNSAENVDGQSEISIISRILKGKGWRLEWYLVFSQYRF